MGTAGEDYGEEETNVLLYHAITQRISRSWGYFLSEFEKPFDTVNFRNPTMRYDESHLRAIPFALLLCQNFTATR